VPYPPLRFFQSGRHQPRRATIFCRTAITPLTSCLTPGVHFSRNLFPELHLLAAKVRDIGLHEIDVSEQPEIGIHAGNYFFSATELDSS